MLYTRAIASLFAALAHCVVYWAPSGNARAFALACDLLDTHDVLIGADSHGWDRGYHAAL